MRQIFVPLDSRTVIRNLTRDECLHALSSEKIGRLSLSVGALPAIVPIRYEVREESLFFVASPDSHLAFATDDAIVAFEADHWEEGGAPGWSVLAIGRAIHGGESWRELSPGLSNPGLRRQPMTDRVVSIDINCISGVSYVRSS